MCFARNGDDKSIRELIRAGADVNIVNKLGETAMSIARENDHLKCIGALVQAGAVVKDGEYLSDKGYGNKTEVSSNIGRSASPRRSEGIHHQMAEAACCNPPIPPTAPSTSDVNHEIGLEEPPRYEELFPFMLK